MYVIVCMLILLAAVILVLVILVQAPKGGGLGAGFGGGSANFMGGAQRATDILEKATWGLMAFILAACVVSTAFIETNVQNTNPNQIENTDVMEDIINE